jgi:uncharacterized protein (DUF4415 family)
MKSDTTLPKFPANHAQWEKVIALAPGKDRASTRTESIARKDAVVVTKGGYAAVRQALTKKRQGQRGAQQRPTKLAVTVRYNPEVIAYFKATGAGWQTRMNDALREWVDEHQAA